jgi:hypothetical protein
MALHSQLEGIADILFILTGRIVAQGAQQRPVVLQDELIIIIQFGIDGDYR